MLFWHPFIQSAVVAPFRGFGVNASRLLWMEWRQALLNWIVGPSCRFTGVARGRSFSTFQLFKRQRRRQPIRSLYANTLAQTLANPVRATPEKECDWPLSLWRWRQHQASDMPSVKRKKKKKKMPSVKRWRRRPVWIGYTWTMRTLKAGQAEHDYLVIVWLR